MNTHNRTYYKSNIAVTNGLRSTIWESALTSLKRTIPADAGTDKSHTHTYTQSKRDTSAHIHTTACVCDTSFPFKTPQIYSVGDLNCKWTAVFLGMCCTVMCNCEAFRDLQRGSPDTQLKHIMIEDCLYMRLHVYHSLILCWHPFYCWNILCSQLLHIK